MTVEQAKENHAVRLTGVITYYDPEEPDLFVQDSTGGIWVSLEVVKPTVAIKAGDLVEVQGVTEAPDFAPQIGNPADQSGRAGCAAACSTGFVRADDFHEDGQPASRSGRHRSQGIQRGPPFVPGSDD